MKKFFLTLIFMIFSVVSFANYNIIDVNNEDINKSAIPNIKIYHFDNFDFRDAIYGDFNLLKGCGKSLYLCSYPIGLSKKDVKWESSNTNVVTIDDYDGYVKAVGYGTATITATYNNLTASIKITVKDLESIKIGRAVLEDDYYLDYNDFTLLYGKSEEFEIDCNPIGIYYDDVEWKSSNTNVATVSSKGVVSGVGVGTAVITASYGNIKDTIKVTVTKKLEKINVAYFTSFQDSFKNSNHYDDVCVTKGRSLWFDVSSYPVGLYKGDVVWSSSNENVVKFEETGNGKGYASAVNNGTAVITATYGNVKGTIKVTVYNDLKSLDIYYSADRDNKLYDDFDMVYGKIIDMYTDSTPLNYSDISWSSSNSNVIAIGSDCIESVGYGTANITAKDYNGNIKDTIKVTVKDMSYIPVTSVKLSKTTLSLYKDKTSTLTATVLPEDAYDKTVTWLSSNERVATVKDGLVTGIAGGTATITVTTNDGGYTAICDVTVKDPNILVTNISLNKTSLTFPTSGKSFKLVANVMPTTATVKKVSWSSSDPLVVSVSSTGIVKSIKAGSAVITCSATDGSGVESTCKVSVKSLVTNITLNKTSISFPQAGKKFKLIATINPIEAGNKKVSWSSSDKSIATVSSTGIVTAVGSGVATITCSATDGSGVKAICKVTVKGLVTNISLNKTSITFPSKGKTFKLVATITPTTATVKKVSWSSSDKSIATVSSTGVIKAIKAGNAVITCSATDGSGVKATCNVKVK